MSEKAINDVIPGPSEDADKVARLRLVHAKPDPQPEEQKEPHHKEQSKRDTAPDDFDGALPYTTFADAEEIKQKTWIIKGVIAKGETSSWIAPPGKGKSVLL